MWCVFLRANYFAVLKANCASWRNHRWLVVCCKILFVEYFSLSLIAEGLNVNIAHHRKGVKVGTLLFFN